MGASCATDGVGRGEGSDECLAKRLGGGVKWHVLGQVKRARQAVCHCCMPLLCVVPAPASFGLVSAAVCCFNETGDDVCAINTPLIGLVCEANHPLKLQMQYRIKQSLVSKPLNNLNRQDLHF